MEKLHEYRKKRNFRITSEPKGKKRKRKERLSFVVQEHHASRLHYDFRLEIDGVLKSWAIPKGPSLDPKVKRLAVETEDHPLEYAEFEGTIPKGEYGAGEVYIWDSGTWEPEVEDIHEALEEGNLKFKLHGKKLKGSFVLVRTHYNETKNKNWLFIKHRESKGKKLQ